MTDQELYDQVAEELREGHLHEGLWARAFAASSGFRDHAQAKYIQLRFSQLAEERNAETHRNQMLAKAARIQRTKAEWKSAFLIVARNFSWAAAFLLLFICFGMFTDSRAASGFVTLVFAVFAAILADTSGKAAIELRKKFK